MFEMMPFRKNNVARRDDFFTPFLKNFFDEDMFTDMNYINGNFKVDLKETEDNYLVEADLPGINRDDIGIDYENNYLVISAKRDESIEDKEENYVRREIHYGEYKRSFYVDNVDESKISASFKDGVLKISLPKQTEMKDKKRKIEIQ
jgi:HSP20 family protein